MEVPITWYVLQENRNSKQIGWLTLKDITCHSYHMNLGLKSILGASIKHQIDRLKLSDFNEYFKRDFKCPPS